MPPRATRSAKKQAATPPSKELLKAIDTVDAARLRTIIKDLCATNSALKLSLESQWLILGKDIARYHADTDSEDAGYSDEDENETNEQYEARRQLQEAERSKRPIKLDAQDFTSRFVECENCEEEFDLGDNLRGWCVWHPGTLLPSKTSIPSIPFPNMAYTLIRRQRNRRRPQNLG
jgi:hypothetical protein